MPWGTAQHVTWGSRGNEARAPHGLSTRCMLQRGCMLPFRRRSNVSHTACPRGWPCLVRVARLGCAHGTKHASSDASHHQWQWQSAVCCWGTWSCCANLPLTWTPRPMHCMHRAMRWRYSLCSHRRACMPLMQPAQWQPARCGVRRRTHSPTVLNRRMLNHRWRLQASTDTECTDVAYRCGVAVNGPWSGTGES